MNYTQEAILLLPPRIRQGLDTARLGNAEEIRLRTGQNISIICSDGEYAVGDRKVTEDDIGRILERATSASLHSVSAQLVNGYVTYRGLRIGLCGTLVFDEGRAIGYSSYSSLNIRIPSRFRGDIDNVFSLMLREGFNNTLIAAPPGTGKTTALREIIRRVSDSGFSVGVIDERNEIFPGEITGDSSESGSRTDVMTGADKLTAAMLLLKNMNPQIIAMDEISKPSDAEAVREIFGCGVGIIATAHGQSLEEMRKRRMYRELFDMGMFRYIIEIGKTGRGRSFCMREIKWSGR